MTGDELRQHIDRLGLTYTEAAKQLALSLSGLNHQMRGVRPVARQTERLIELIEELDRREAAPKRRAGER